jgi:hypothetical protein
VLVLFFIASVSIKVLARTTAKEGEEEIGQRGVLSALPCRSPHT